MKWFPHPLLTYTGSWTMFICCGWAQQSIIMPLPTHVSTQMLEVPWNSTSLLCDKGCHCAVVEAFTQHGMDTISPPIIWIWQLSYAVNGHMGPLSCQYHYMCWPRCGKSTGIFITACLGQHKMPLCYGWSSYSTWNGSQFPSHYIPGIGQCSYAVDGHMNLS